MCLDSCVLFCFVLHVDVLLFLRHLLKRLSLLHFMALATLSKISWLYLWGSTSPFRFIDLLVYSVTSTTLSSFLQLYHLGVGWHQFADFVVPELDWHCTESIDQGGRTDVLTTYVSLFMNIKHFSVLCSSSLILFIRVLYFPPNRSYTYFVRFVLKYFVFGGANISGIMFLISASICSLLVFWKASDFCIPCILHMLESH